MCGVSDSFFFTEKYTFMDKFDLFKFRKTCRLKKENATYFRGGGDYDTVISAYFGIFM